MRRPPTLATYLHAKIIKEGFTVNQAVTLALAVEAYAGIGQARIREQAEHIEKAFTKPKVANEQKDLPGLA